MQKRFEMQDSGLGLKAIAWRKKPGTITTAGLKVLHETLRIQIAECIVYWANMGITEQKMETTIVGKYKDPNSVM